MAVNPDEQLSVTVAVPNALLILAAVGLQPSDVAAEIAITGFVVSLVKVTV